MQSENIVTVPIEKSRKNWDGGIFKLGRPLLGRFVQTGQSRTWDGWGVQISLKKMGRPLWMFPNSSLFSLGIVLKLLNEWVAFK